ncbi:hypothetical protein VE04_06719 [Pseudogymnoascus sp. 24MN13]|nr:hypothetical protein VE04_06719 [Pseudogymnoascus sp. 24MN13]
MMFYPSPPKVLGAVVLAQTFFSTAVGAQDASNGAGNTATIELTTLSPAAAVVNGEQLFPSERLQLTDAVLANLTSLGVDTSLFAFGTPNDAETLGKRTGGKCKAFPGDKAWPSKPLWKLLDLLSGGQLIATIPSASSCYKGWGDEDETECTYVTDNWTNSFFHMEDPTSVMWPLWQGRTCLPTPSPSTPCTLGGYPSYALNITTISQIQLAVNFARVTNIRLVIKNTGHDFNGRSAGAGALAVWTHHLKDIKLLESYKTPSYKGRAVKIGAGEQALELYEAGKKLGFTAVGGEGKTVGIAGGYVAGGGHSPLSSIYGLAADHVLAFEIVLADGRFVTASESSNTELFWALRGGGGATYGVVTSVVFKVYPVMKATAVQFSVANPSTAPGGVSVDSFWAGARAYFDYFIPHTEAGAYSYFSIVGTAPGEYMFNMLPFFAPNMTQSQTAELLAPWLADLKDLGIEVDPVYFPADNFHDAWDAGFPLEAVGGSAAKTGGRLFPRKNWEDEATLNATFDAIKYPVEEGGMFLGFNIAAPGRGRRGSALPDNAVNPAWRETVLHAIAVIFLLDPSPEAIAVQSERLTMDWLGRWRDPDVQQSFYGDSKYPRLYALKKKMDPYGLFYAPTAVGSEDWYVTDQIEWLPTQNGRLCRV